MGRSHLGAAQFQRGHVLGAVPIGLGESSPLKRSGVAPLALVVFLLSETDLPCGSVCFKPPCKPLTKPAPITCPR